MRAAVVNVLGDAPKYQSFPDPVAGDGEVLVHVRAAGLHPIVKARASGAHYSASKEVPLIPGIDGVGVLEDGTRVLFAFVRSPWGTLAELAAVRRTACIPLPDGLSDEQAAAIANPGMSAWMSLKERGGLVPGETVLILGATGVAGNLAIQSARQLGAKRVIGVGRNVDALAGTGVDAIIALGQPEDAIREAFEKEAAAGIDLIIDYLWGRPTELLLEAIAKGFSATESRRIRLVEVGTSAGQTIALHGAILRSVDLTMMGSGFGASPLDKIFAALPEIFKMAAEGKLKIDVEPMPLSQVESAWNRQDKGRRIVFTI